MFVPGIRLSRVWVLASVWLFPSSSRRPLLYQPVPMLHARLDKSGNEGRQSFVPVDFFSAESPHVATLAEVLWAGRVEILAHLGSEGLVEWGVHRRVAVSVIRSSGIPFRRCHYGLAGGFPGLLRPSRLFVSSIGWVIHAWQCLEIWTITELSTLKYTFVTFTCFPFLLMRRVPGRTSLICIPPEGLAKSVHPERHVCPVLRFPGGAVGRAVLSGCIWSSLSC